MWGWESEATARASFSKRRMLSGSLAVSGGQDLDRHLAAEPRVRGPVDLAHAAAAEAASDFVRTEPRAGGKAHSASRKSMVAPWTEVRVLLKVLPHGEGIELPAYATAGSAGLRPAGRDRGGAR